MKLDDWDLWKPELVNHVKSLCRQAATPLDCIIRDPGKTVNNFPANNEANRLIYAVALNGPVF